MFLVVSFQRQGESLPKGETLSSCDVLIIGGGPVGLFGAFYAGLRHMSVTIVDSLPELGGQLTALYPEKYIYDMPGFPKVLAKDLVARMVEQGLQFGATVRLDERCRTLEREGECWKLSTTRDAYLARTVIITAGIGSFEPRRLGLPEEARYLGKGLYYGVKERAAFAVPNLMIVGGGDSAFDWALALHESAGETTVVHRRDVFAAHEESVAKVLASPIKLKCFREVAALHGEDWLEAATLKDPRTGETERVPVQAMSVNIGFVADLGPLREWGLDLQGNRIRVNERRETNLPGVFAAGDIASYEGKLKLIATGVGEVCTAVNFAKTYLDPSAPLFPGHSTHMVLPEKST